MRYFNSNDSMYPMIESEDNYIRIIFEEKVYAKDFSGYFGKIQECINDDKIYSVDIDFRNVMYINLFCISKILLTIWAVMEKKRVTILWPNPEGYKKCKMLRFLYNKGILDLLFSNAGIINVIDGNVTSNYAEYYDFRECFDSAIYPYHIFRIGNNEDEETNEETIKQIIGDIMFHVKNYLEKYRRNSFTHIESRLYLYLYEIIENIYIHAYEKGGDFAVTIAYDYLPAYVWKKDRASKAKYDTRVKNLQKQIPLSIYGDVQERYMGSISVFIDDIGRGIDSTIEGGYYQQLYRDTFLEGLAPDKRGKGKTRLNGLRLVGEQIANNGDYLWLHDNWHWIGSYCVEKTTQIAKEDESRCAQRLGGQYISGVTYDLSINLARNSMEKKKSYDSFGIHINMDFVRLQEIIQRALDEDSKYGEYNLIDLWNPKNSNKTSIISRAAKGEVLFYRSRAIRKETFKNELFDNIFSNIVASAGFEEMVIYDLNETSFFQIRAQIETNEYSQKIAQCGISRVLLFTEEMYMSVLEYNGDKFEINKQYAKDYITNKREIVFKYIEYIHHCDERVLQELIEENGRSVLTFADIKWSGLSITKYLDIKALFSIRDIYTLAKRTLLRINGLLGNKVKIGFIEEFLEDKFGEFVNEYMEQYDRRVYVGSVILTRNTERKKEIEDDLKIYFFCHEECKIENRDKYIFCFNFPKSKVKWQNKQYRRVGTTSAIELYNEESEQYRIYLDEIEYAPAIGKVDYQIGLFPSGLIQINENEKLYDAYVLFVIMQLKVIITKYKNILIKWEFDKKINNYELYCTKIEEEIEKCQTRYARINISFDGGKVNKPDMIVHLMESISLHKLLELKTEEDNCLIITIYNKIWIADRIDGVISNGYLPMLPFNISEKSHITDEVKRFEAYCKTLMPTYRKEIEKFMLDAGGFEKTDFSMDFERYYNMPMGNSEHYNILHKFIKAYVSCFTGNYLEDSFSDENQEYMLILLFVWWYEIQVNNGRDCENLLEKMVNNLIKNSDKESTVVECYLLFIFYLSNAKLAFSAMDLKRDYLKENLAGMKNKIVKVLLAMFINQWDYVELRKELNDVFISNDISLYYRMLYQLLFNNCGSDHESIIGRYAKQSSLTNDEKQRVPELVDEVVSLLKLTGPQTGKQKIEEIERELFKFYKEENFLSQFHDKWEELKNLGLSRFNIFQIENFGRDVKKFIIEIVGKNAVEKGERQNVDLEKLKDFVLAPSQVNADSMKNIVIPNDQYLIDEISYLLLDAFKHSGGHKISTQAESHKETEVIVRCGLCDGNIVFSLYNSLLRDFEEVKKETYNKRRVGKTHLEKFNINITYYKNPEEILHEKCNVIETRIEIPYFV